MNVPSRNRQRLLPGVSWTLACSLLSVLLWPARPALAQVDPQAMAAAPARRAAEEEVRASEGRIAEARTEVSRCRSEMDAFLAEHFDRLQSRVAAPNPVVAQPVAPPTVAPDPALAELQNHVKSLQAERAALLERLTPAHPEVADIEMRIAEATARLAKLEADRPPAVNPAIVTANPPHESWQIEKERDERAVAQYDELVDRWKGAQHDLEFAIAARQAAEERLAALVPATSAPTPLLMHPVEAPRGPQISQPVAVLVLLGALAVAAIASVLLARSNTTATFSSVEEISAALALPIVGVFPAAETGGTSRSARTLRFRPLTLVVQVVAAFAAFALTAYAVLALLDRWQ